MENDVSLFAKTARLPDGWAQNVRIRLEAGQITHISPNAEAAPDDVRVDALVPALCNLHSHTFQRAMAGRTETRRAGRDSFWTWRDLMYRFLDHLSPDHIEAIATLAFMEMLESGFGAVGEFHYVHHQPGGVPYGDLGELSQRIFNAAAKTGIGLTHLPVMYRYGGLDQRALEGGQQRFGNDPDRFEALFAACQSGIAHLPADTTLGVAPHSLRAVSAADLARLTERFDSCPIHIHIAEQTKEVDDVHAALGARPVEWLLDHAAVDARWCLIHATHLSEAETRAMAKSGAVAGLCPVTEANLGDGIFNATGHLAAGGKFGVGTDSNVCISATDELRALEYSQRLRDRARNVVASPDTSTGAQLYLGAALGGAQALGRASGALRVGDWADMVGLDGSAVTLAGLSGDQLLDGVCFAARGGEISDVWSAGRHVVQGGRHIAREQIEAGYRTALSDLMARV
ncbi:MAG: formimidoylglutamate deiminase [Sedimentitalea sp.]